MTYALDDIVHSGAVAAAALVTRSLHHGPKPGVSIFGGKSPVAVLVRAEDKTLAFRPDGTQIAPDAFERRFPGWRAEFERRVTASGT